MRAAVVVALLLAALAVASAARVPDGDLMDIKDTISDTASFQRWLGLARKGKGDKPAYAAFKYYVQPQHKEDFVEAWRKMEESTKEEKGLKIYDLKKPMTDNLLWVGYGEWETMRDYLEHFESDYVQEFLDTLAEHDVPWSITPLYKPDVAELHSSNKGKTDKQQAHVLIRYTVPPSKQEAFKDAWNEAEKGTEGEKGAHIYSLRKVLGDNMHFIAYGTWETMQDYEEHFKSGHVKQLRKALDEHDIIWQLSPLIKVGDQPE
ncbi:hypothetical protein OEZ85_002304 [Tetradesmus obliquus]|uniref:ABM domain-containing protein n=1 Tax=Tetradesmus obliquus TaxID=3088 RepID=A0ABY8U7N3_TETOB|nr:hypothetical protein OEZ85_002304 [Tetradesmus obliquus]